MHGRSNKKILLFIVIFTLTIGARALAEDRFVLLQTDQFSTTYLNTARIQMFVLSKFRDVWIKKSFTAAKPTEKKVTSDKKVHKKGDKNGKNAKNIVSQLIHIQFDPVTYRYKVLEIISFDENENIVPLDMENKPNTRSTPKPISTIGPIQTVAQLDWKDICPGSMEEKALIVVDDYINQNPDMVMVR